MRNLKKILALLIVCVFLFGLLPAELVTAAPDVDALSMPTDTALSESSIDITDDFTDLIFRAAVYAAIGKSSPERIYDDDVMQVDWLRVSSRGIQSLAGLEWLTALTDLNCSNNQLAELPSLPDGLEVLSCDRNHLTSLPNLPDSLEELDCTDNQLTALPMLPDSLKYLMCADNKVMVLPALPGGLEYLDCDNNRLSSLPTLPAGLKNLYCSGNFLTGFDVTGLSLDYLICSNNYIPDPSAVIGFPTSKWDNRNYIFNPQKIKPDDITDDFTDLNFRAAVYEIIDKSPPEFIFEADVAGISWLGIGDRDIESLAGLEWFTSLSTLDCRYNQLTELPVLPDSLRFLYCYYNRLTSLPTLPDNLEELICSDNLLTSLPVLPDGLESLDCGGNPLKSLPKLPDSLLSLDCLDNELTQLPTLPSGLESLFCGNNPLMSLPKLPESLVWLSCLNTGLSELSALPEGLERLNCGSNQLTALPKLPDGLTSLNCWDNELTELPLLPSTLNYLDCDENLLSALPVLPLGLVTLYCTSNQLTSLPALPGSLRNLYCGNNQLSSLPALPVGLKWFHCYNNLLTEIDVNGLQLENFNCSGNYIPDPSAVIGFPIEGWNDSEYIFLPQNTPPAAWSVSGTVRSYNPKKPTTVILMSGTTVIETIIIEGTSVSGRIDQRFEFKGIVSGTYSLVIEKEAHTRFTVQSITVVDGDVDLTQDDRPEVRVMALRCGDIVGDGVINDDDLTELWNLANYNMKTTNAFNKRCDLNGDGMVNDLDLTILWMAYNYNKGNVVIQ